jgi:hypothetical protein
LIIGFNGKISGTIFGSVFLKGSEDSTEESPKQPFPLKKKYFACFLAEAFNQEVILSSSAYPSFPCPELPLDSIDVFVADMSCNCLHGNL